MTPAPLDLVVASSVADAIEVLVRDEDAKLIAGGQSLVPLLAMRLARPTVLVDISRLPLDAVDLDPEDGELRIGALISHAELLADDTIATHAPVLRDAAGLIGHPAIRNRGTIGGSLAHADPAAELPAALVALDAKIMVEGSGGGRLIRATEMWEGFLTTTLRPDEVITGVTVARAPQDRTASGSFCEWAPRAGDFAVAGVAVRLERAAGGVITLARAATCGVGSVPLDISDAMGAAVGEHSIPDGLLRAVAFRARRACALVAVDDDRAELAGLLAARALWRAAA
ncbi:MAG: FAD binding domain-containing protein [Acidimicrobiales bacterium]